MRQEQFILFVRPRDKERETWTGRRAGIEGAVADFGADRAFAIDELDGVLRRHLDKVERIYYPLGINERMNARILELLRAAQAMRPRLGTGPHALLDPRELIHEARLLKRPEELAAMRDAIAISAEAHKAAMRTARGGMMEWQIEATVDYTFRSRGAAGPSYPSIIASGPNAATLHYINNDREMRTGELLLIDAGCEYGFYASDVTRTFPIGARFTPLQRDLYEIVLEAQLKGIEAIRPGIKFDDPHDAAVRVLVEGMCRVGLIKGPVEDALKRGCVAALLHASHQPLARHGRARRRALSRRRRVAHARTRDGAHGRAGNLHRTRRRRGARGVSRHRHSHRGRHPRYPRRSRSDDGGGAEIGRRGRSADHLRADSSRSTVRSRWRCRRSFSCRRPFRTRLRLRHACACPRGAAR